MSINQNNFVVDEQSLVNINKKCPLSNPLIYNLFMLGCKYALKYINQNRYQEKIAAFAIHEVDNLVYLALLYTLKHYQWNYKKGSCTFKNYFFQIIRFAAIKELKVNYQEIYSTKWKSLIRDSLSYIDFGPKKNLEKKVLINQKIVAIKKFLATKKPLYVKLITDKLEGLTNKQIAQKHNLNENLVKAHYQYIKKLVLQKFKTIDQLN